MAQDGDSTAYALEAFPDLVFLGKLDDRFSECEGGAWLRGWETLVIPRRVTAESVLQWLTLMMESIPVLRDWERRGAPWLSVHNDHAEYVRDAYRLVRSFPEDSTPRRYARRLEGPLTQEQVVNELEAILHWLQDLQAAPAGLSPCRRADRH